MSEKKQTRAELLLAVGDLSSRNAALESRNAALEDERDFFKTHLAIQEEETANLDGNLRRATQRIRELQTEVDSLESRLAPFPPG